MAEIVNPVVEGGVFVGMDPATGIVAGIAADGTVKVLELWDPVQGDAFHRAPAGSAIGGGTRRHLFDREVYVDSTGAGAYVNVRAWASITGKPTTIAGYAITDAITTAGGQTIAGQLTVSSIRAGAATWASLGQVRLPNNNVIAWRNAADSADFTLRLGAGNRFALDAGLDVNGALLPVSDNSSDLGDASHRWRNFSMIGVATIVGKVVAGVNNLNGYRLVQSGGGEASFAIMSSANIFIIDESQFGTRFNGGVGINTAPPGAGSLALAGSVVVGTTLATGGSITLGDGVFIVNRNAGPVYTAYQLATVTKGLVGVASAAGELVTGSAAGDMVMYSNANVLFSVNSGSSVQAKVNSAGHFIPGADNSYDLGSASFRWRDALFSRNVTVAGQVIMAIGGRILWNAGGTGSTVGDINIDGGTAAGGGAMIRFQRNATPTGYIGHESAINGGASPDFTVYGSSGSSVRIYADAAAAPQLKVSSAIVIVATKLQVNDGGSAAVAAVQLSGSGGYGISQPSGVLVNIISNGSSVASFSSAASSATALFTAPAGFTGSVVSAVTGTAAGTGFQLFTGTTASGDRIYIRGNGDIINTNNSYGAISDEREKSGIVAAASQWADVLAWKLRKFRLNSDPDGREQLGVVAQELRETSPGLVDTFDVRDPQTLEPTGETRFIVKYSVMNLKAIGALQEAMRRLEAVEAWAAGMGYTVPAFA